MKKFCKSCDHRCHCVGQGYFVSRDKCDICICERCECETVTSDKTIKKSWWQRYVDWLFG